MLAVRVLVAGVVMASRLVRTNAVTVNDVLDGHKLLEIDCVDRVYLTLPVPTLVVGGQVVNFLTAQERRPIPSPALLKMHRCSASQTRQRASGPSGSWWAQATNDGCGRQSQPQ